MENFNAIRNISEMFNVTNHVKAKSEKGGYSPRQPKRVPRTGSTCKNCGLKMSVSGSCFCNE